MKTKKILVWVIVFMMFFTTISFANSAGPPGITIIAGDCPEDLQVFVVVNEREEMLEKKSVFFETHFIHFEGIGHNDRYSKLIFRSQEKTFEVDMASFGQAYDYIFTLDFDHATLKEGKSLLRSLMLVSTRIMMTLIIEGLIFYLFGFRFVKSWVLFVLINMVTQGYLNLSLNNLTPTEASYMGILMLLVYEVFILIGELFFFLLLVRENTIKRTSLYVVTANIASLILGLILIPFLPV